MAWYERDYNQQTTYRDSGGRSGGGMGGMMGGAFSRAPVTMWLITINFVIFVLDQIFSGSSRGNWLSPSNFGAFSIDKAVYGWQLWRWVTYQFLHAGFMHLFFNMIGLYFFGPLLEGWWGRRRFVAFYLLCGSCGSLIFTLLAFIPGLLHVGTATFLIGASGSLFGILAACAVLYPHQRVMLLFPPIPMSMRTMALIFLGIAALSILAGARNAGGDAAHLGGALLGFILVKNAYLLNFAQRIGQSGPAVNPYLKRQQQKAKRQRQFLEKEQTEVDRILDKVRAAGMQSLTGREKKTLKRATERQRRAS